MAKKLPVAGSLSALLVLAALWHGPIAHGQSGEAPTRDVTPDMGGVTSTFSEAFAVDDGRLLVFAGRAGFRRTNNGGKLWQRAMDGYVSSNGVEPYGNGFCQAPSRPSTVYSPSGTLLGGPVFRTDDLGRRWRSVGAIAEETIVIDCAVDASNPDVFYVLQPDTFDKAALFKSTDGGQTFTAVGGGLEGLNVYRVRTSPTRPQTLYVVGRTTTYDEEGGFTVTGSVYVSNDGGVSFAPLRASPPIPSRVQPHPTRDGMLFVSGVADDGQRQLFRSTDGGVTFTPVGPVGGSFVAFDPDDPAAVYALIGTDGLYRSRDFGATFARLPGPTASQMGPLGINAVAVTTSRNGRTHVYVGTARGAYRSDDGGHTFTSIRDTYRGAGVNDLAIDAAGRLMVGAVPALPVFRAQKPGHPRSYEIFSANFPATPGLDAGAVAPSPVDANTAVVATRFGAVFATADGGATWTEATERDGNPLGPFFFGSRVRAVFAPGSATRVYLFAGFGLFRSDDAGLSFQEVGSTRPGFDRAFAVDPSNPDVIYLAGQDRFSPFPFGLLKSLDGGQTVVSLGVFGDFSMLAIDPDDSQTVYVGNRAGGVPRSMDGGATWQDASRGLSPGATLAVAADPRIAGRVYAWVQAGGLFVSQDRGGNWMAADTGESLRRSGIEIGQAAIAVDRVVPGRVYLGNSGVLQVDTVAEEGR